MKKLIFGLTLLISFSSIATADECKVKIEPVKYQVAGNDSVAIQVAKNAIESRESNFVVVSSLDEANLILSLQTIAGHYTLESDIKGNNGLVSQKLRKGAVATVQIFKTVTNSSEPKFVTGVRAFEDQYFNNISNSHERIREAINALPSCEEILTK